MKALELKVSKRQSVGKKSTKELRKQEEVPCVMYGGKETLHFTAHQNVFKDLIYTPNVYLLKIDIEGDIHHAVLQDIQFHPVTDQAIHIDFVEYFDDRPVTLKLPINIIGDSVGLKKGGKLKVKRRYLKVKALPKDLPDVLDVDITKLDIGKTIKVGDLGYKNLTLLDPFQSLILGVFASRLSKGSEPGESEGETAEEATPETTEETNEA